MSALVLVPGVRIRYETRRAARGKLPWALVLDVRLRGKRVATAKFFASRAEAEAAYPAVAGEVARQRAELEAEQRLLDALKVPPLPTAPKGVFLFETLAGSWLEEHARPMLAPATYKNYKRLLNNHLLKIMRTWPMTGEVMTGKRVMHVLKVELAQKGVPLATRLACLTCLSAFFAWAKGQLPPSAQFDSQILTKQGRYVRNPHELDVELGGSGANPMTRVQAEAFLEYQRVRHPDLYEWFVWHIDEGSRLGEVAALKWEHLDLAAGKGHIVESFSWAQLWLDKQNGLETFGEKKTKTGRRNQYIDLSDRVRTLFPALRARQLEAWMARGRYGKEPRHCFLTRDLTPRRPDASIYTAFREACDELHLEGALGQPFTIHCLRDTFATLAILSGKPIGWVAMMLGHANAVTTQNYYIRWIRLIDVNLLSGEQGGVK